MKKTFTLTDWNRQGVFSCSSHTDVADHILPIDDRCG